MESHVHCNEEDEEGPEDDGVKDAYDSVQAGPWGDTAQLLK